jgi:hypothetical protein
MKSSAMAVVSTAILMVMASVGSGIALAGENHGYRPVSSFEDQEALEQGISSGPYAESRPVLGLEDYGTSGEIPSPVDDVRIASDGRDYVPEGNWSAPIGRRGDRWRPARSR